MADLLTGAGVGAAFGEGFTSLHEAVKCVVGRIILFKSILKRLESTLDGVEPLVQEVRDLSLALDRPNKETKSLIEQMDKGRELVLKCSKIKRWSLIYCVKACCYSKQLEELNDAIERFCKFNLIATNARTGLETLIKVNQNTNIGLQTLAKMGLVLEEVTKQNLDLKKKKCGFQTLSCAVSRPRDYIVGLELPLKELKTLLSNKQESLLLLTALGSCEKTALVKMLCWDDDIRGIYGENIFFVKASQAPNLKVMVKLFNHNGEECPEFQSDEEAIDQLEQLLNQTGQKQPILLILDDVWPGSESLIEKFKVDIPAYKIVDKTTGKRINIIITEKGRHSKEMNKKLVQEAEKYKAEDEEHNMKTELKNALENCAYNMRNTLGDKRNADKVPAFYKRFVEEVIEETNDWLERNQLAQADEFEDKMSKLESIHNLVISMIGQGDDSDMGEATLKDEDHKEEIKIHQGVDSDMNAATQENTNPKKEILIYQGPNGHMAIATKVVNKLQKEIKDKGQEAEKNIVQDKEDKKKEIREKGLESEKNIAKVKVEKYRAEDKEHKKKIEAKDALENYANYMRYKINDVKNNLIKTEDAIEQTILWLQRNQLSEADEYVDKMKALEDICHPFIAKM